MASVSALKRWSATGRSRSTGAPRRDHTGVHAGPVQPAEEPRVFDLDAAVHHRVKAGGASQPVGLEVHHADLLPQAARADVDRLARNRQDVFGAAKHIDQVDRTGNVPEAREAAFAENLGIARVYRNDPIAVLLHVLRGEETGPMPFGREPDHGDRPTAAQDAAEFGNFVGHRISSRVGYLNRIPIEKARRLLTFGPIRAACAALPLTQFQPCLRSKNCSFSVEPLSAAVEASRSIVVLTASK